MDFLSTLGSFGQSLWNSVFPQPLVSPEARPNVVGSPSQIKLTVGGASAPATPTQPSPSPAPTSAPVSQPFNRAQVEQNIRQGFAKYGNPPVASLSAQFADLAAKYPALQQHPYLLPALSINETSGGKNVTFPNNPLNWGIHVQGFNPGSFGEVLQKAAAGIGGDPSSMSSGIYADFRNTGNLMDFVHHYAPPNENDSKAYYQNLLANMQRFQGGQ